jgi:hypothetical protein
MLISNAIKPVPGFWKTFEMKIIFSDISAEEEERLKKQEKEKEKRR